MKMWLWVGPYVHLAKGEEGEYYGIVLLDNNRLIDGKLEVAQKGITLYDHEGAKLFRGSEICPTGRHSVVMPGEACGIRTNLEVIYSEDIAWTVCRLADMWQGRCDWDGRPYSPKQGEGKQDEPSEPEPEPAKASLKPLSCWDLLHELSSDWRTTQDYRDAMEAKGYDPLNVSSALSYLKTKGVVEKDPDNKRCNNAKWRLVEGSE